MKKEETTDYNMWIYIEKVTYLNEEEINFEDVGEPYKLGSHIETFEKAEQIAETLEYEY